jgi:predicted nucleic acid-binding Zn ribbon protein
MNTTAKKIDYEPIIKEASKKTNTIDEKCNEILKKLRKRKAKKNKKI